MADTIEQTVRDYVEGSNLGDVKRLMAALHPDFRTTGSYDGKQIWMTRDDALDAVGRQEHVPAWEMGTPEIHGDTAQVRVCSDWNGSAFVELLTLIRLSGDWQIVFKTFHVARTG